MNTIPVVALHGFMGSPDTFRGLIERSAFPFVALDIPYVGPERSDDLSEAHDRVAGLLLQQLDARGISRFHLLGYSLGGRIAMHVSHAAPDRVECLILESANPGLVSPEDRAARCRHDAAWAQRIRTDWPAVLEAWYDQGVFASLAPNLRARLIDEKRERDPYRMADMLEALSVGRQRPFWEDLRRSSRPTLFVSGEMDERYTSIGERLAVESGPIRHHNVPGAGHVVHREKPEAYLAALQSFLNQ